MEEGTFVLYDVEAKFEPGRVVCTRTVFDAIDKAGLIHNLVFAELMQRHLQGDWGDLSPEDIATNESALVNGDRLLSSYQVPGVGKVWVITEWDRSVTTILLPEDY